MQLWRLPPDLQGIFLRLKIQNRSSRQLFCVLLRPFLRCVKKLALTERLSTFASPLTAIDCDFPERSDDEMWKK